MEMVLGRLFKSRSCGFIAVETNKVNTIPAETPKRVKTKQCLEGKSNIENTRMVQSDEPKMTRQTSRNHEAKICLLGNQTKGTHIVRPSGKNKLGDKMENKNNKVKDKS